MAAKGKSIGGNTGKNTDKKHRRKRSPRSLANLKPPWKPGQSGNPNGRPGDALTLDLHKILGDEWRAGLTIGEHIVWQVVKRALRGNLAAISFVWDRLEGKPRQALDVTTTPAPVDLVAVRRRSAERLADEFGLSVDQVLADLEGES
jgi:hypothetical protein